MDLEKDKGAGMEYQSPSIEFLAADEIKDGAEPSSLIVMAAALLLVYVAVGWSFGVSVFAWADVAVSVNHKLDN